MKFSKTDKTKETVKAEELKKIPEKIASQIFKVKEEIEKALKDG